MTFVAFGLSHRSSPVEVREQFAFSEALVPQALEQLRRQTAAEAVILSTCNRVELYIARPIAAEPNLEHLTQFLAEFHTVPADRFQSHLYHREDRAMIEHLSTFEKDLHGSNS